MKSKSKHIVIFVLGILLGLLVLANSLVFFFRLDLTENNTYSLSKSTKTMLREIPDTLNITYYLSFKLVDKSPIVRDIKDLVMEFSNVSKGKVNVEIVNTDKMDVASLQQKGFQPLQLQVSNANEVSKSYAFSGLMLEYLDKKEIFPSLTYLESLEYELVKKIKKMVFDYESSVGILNLDSSFTKENQLMYIYQVLEQSLKVETVEAGDVIPNTINCLLVVGTTDDDFNLLPIDQYIMNGGSALFLTETNKVMISEYQGMLINSVDNKLVKLLENYGVNIDNKILVSKNCNQGWIQIPPLAYPYFIRIPGASGNEKNPVTAQFTGCNLLWANPLSFTKEAEDNSDLKKEILVEAKSISEMDGNSDINFGRPISFENSIDTAVALTLSGKFDSYYKTNSVPKRDGEPELFSAIKKGSENSEKEPKIMVVGDTSFVTIDQQNKILGQIYSAFNIDWNANFKFLLDSVEWLANDDDLMQIRTRANRNLSFDKIQNPKLRSAYFIIIQVVILGIVPLVIILIGIIRLILRKKKARGE